jgi:hypothetical protein
MKIITIFILSFIILSCSKKEMIHVSAINPVTGEPYAGLRFTITEEKTGSQEIFTKVYDNNLNTFGEALFEFKLKKNRSYKLSLETPANICYKEPADITFAIQDDSFDFKFELAPCAFIILKLNNVNCSGSSDIMKLYRSHTIKEYYSNNAWQHDGCVNWESNGYSDLPMGEIKYKWEVTRNGITNTFYDTIYLSEGEYRTYEINY